MHFCIHRFVLIICRYRFILYTVVSKKYLLFIEIYLFLAQPPKILANPIRARIVEHVTRQVTASAVNASLNSVAPPAQTRSHVHVYNLYKCHNFHVIWCPNIT